MDDGGVEGGSYELIEWQDERERKKKKGRRKEG